MSVNKHHRSTFTGSTSSSDDTSTVNLTDLVDTFNAFELNLVERSSASNLPVMVDDDNNDATQTGANKNIHGDEAQLIANRVCRSLKYYLGATRFSTIKKVIVTVEANTVA